jgi:hypothetical protein
VHAHKYSNANIESRLEKRLPGNNWVGPECIVISFHAADIRAGRQSDEDPGRQALPKRYHASSIDLRGKTELRIGI